MQKKPYKITLLGTGLIGNFYTQSLHEQRKADRVHTVYSRSEERAKKFAGQWDIPHWETDIGRAIQSPRSAKSPPSGSGEAGRQSEKGRYRL